MSLRTTLTAVLTGTALVGTLAVLGVGATSASAAVPEAALAVSASGSLDGSVGDGSLADGSSQVATPDGATSPPQDTIRQRARAFWQGLTDEQRQCLRDAELTRPLGRPTVQQRDDLIAEVHAAADSCGITLPTRPGAQARERARAYWLGLTDEQRQCLRDAELTRPLGRLTGQQRADLREEVRGAAAGCGVDLPQAPVAAMTQ